jgi:hypothetical protein
MDRQAKAYCGQPISPACHRRPLHTEQNEWTGIVRRRRKVDHLVSWRMSPFSWIHRLTVSPDRLDERDRDSGRGSGSGIVLLTSHSFSSHDDRSAITVTNQRVGRWLDCGVVRGLKDACVADDSRLGTACGAYWPGLPATPKWETNKW